MKKKDIFLQRLLPEIKYENGYSNRRLSETYKHIGMKLS